MQRKKWTWDELTIAFELYCRTPFGRIHRNNPEIIQIAKLIKRTPSALAMKLSNFASFDPAHKSRKVIGLSHVSRIDREIWDEYSKKWAILPIESRKALLRFQTLLNNNYLDNMEIPTGRTEKLGMSKVRLVQTFFRNAVLTSYESKCAICSLSLPYLINASHIIPWKDSSERRADPHNGIALCVLHDRAFDLGIITIDDQYRVIVSTSIRIAEPPKLHQVGLIEIAGQSINLPSRFLPDHDALDFHRTTIFQGES